MTRPFLPLAALALAACATVPLATASPTAAFGQVAAVDGVRVRPLAVIEDSRCPSAVQCVWAGRVRLLAQVSLDRRDAAMQRDLILGEPVAVFGGTLTLIAVEPPKLAPGTTDPRAYRFTFRFVR
ncbi:MAG: hypothetical protein ABIW16_06210 [Sphingomicrobium sp.]